MPENPGRSRGAVDPAWESKLSARDQVDAMDAASFFTLFAQLMKTNPPAAADAPMVPKLAKIGIVPGKDFERAGAERWCQCSPD